MPEALLKHVKSSNVTVPNSFNATNDPTGDLFMSQPIEQVFSSTESYIPGVTDGRVCLLTQR